MCLFFLISFLDRVHEVKQPNYMPSEQVIDLFITTKRVFLKFSCFFLGYSSLSCPHIGHL